MPATDRELLELAAKAAGLEIMRWGKRGYAEGFAHLRSGGIWNPLIEDGDALRLAVKLGLILDARYTKPEAMTFNRVNYWPAGGESAPYRSIEFDLLICPLAAARRAIVRAAAAMAAPSSTGDSNAHD